VGQHRRVRLPVPGAADAHERLRQHVMKPIVRGVDRVAAEQRGERELLALYEAAW
jgi:hypothetical protein